MKSFVLGVIWGSQISHGYAPAFLFYFFKIFASWGCCTDWMCNKSPCAFKQWRMVVFVGFVLEGISIHLMEFWWRMNIYFVSGMLIVHISKHSFFCTHWSEISFQVESFNFCKVCMLFGVLCVLCACLILSRGRWRHHAVYFEELFGTWIGIGNRVEYGNGISRHLDVHGGHRLS